MLRCGAALLVELRLADGAFPRERLKHPPILENAQFVVFVAGDDKSSFSRELSLRLQPVQSSSPVAERCFLSLRHAGRVCASQNRGANSCRLDTQRTPRRLRAACFLPPEQPEPSRQISFGCPLISRWRPEPRPPPRGGGCPPLKPAPDCFSSETSSSVLVYVDTTTVTTRTTARPATVAMTTTIGRSTTSTKMPSTTTPVVRRPRTTTVAAAAPDQKGEGPDPEDRQPESPSPKVPTARTDACGPLLAMDVSWPKTKPGSVSRMPCPPGTIGKADGGGRWS